MRHLYRQFDLETGPHRVTVCRVNHASCCFHNRPGDGETKAAVWHRPFAACESILTERAMPVSKIFSIILSASPGPLSSTFRVIQRVFPSPQLSQSEM